MNYLHNGKMIGAALLLALGCVACEKPGPAEQAGKKIDQSIDEAAKKIDAVVDKADRKMGEESTKTTQAMADTEITARVKASIFAEPGLRSLQISVDTTQGVVTLSGAVDSAENSERASALARAVAGVKSVENKLTPVAGK